MKYPVLLPNIFDYPFTYESNIKLKAGDYAVSYTHLRAHETLR